MKADELENLEELEAAASTDPIAGAVRKLIAEIGEDPDREGILNTPARVASPCGSSPVATIRTSTRC